jgi:hypothetical protein
MKSDIRAPRTFSTIASAGSLSGTRCSRPAFIRLAGMVQTPASRSISLHCAPRTSPDRAAVKPGPASAVLHGSAAVPQLGRPSGPPFAGLIDSWCKRRRVRRSPMMRCAAGALGRDAAAGGDENIDYMVTRSRLERRERRTGRAGLDGHGGQPTANVLSEMWYAVQIAPQHLLANAPGFVRSRSAGHCESPPRALEVSQPAV